jgi:hypothetical protein
VGVASAGLFIVVAYTVARALLVGRRRRRRVGTRTSATCGRFGWLLAGVGAVVAAAAASLIAPVDVERPLRAAWRLATTEPHTTPCGSSRAALVAAGLLLIIKPLAALQVAVTLAGVYLLFQGLAIVLRIAPRPGEERTAPATRHARARRIAVPVLAAALIAAGVFAFAAGGGTEARRSRA